MSNQLAVDVVLLPSVEVMSELINLIDYNNDSVIKLDTAFCLPHISLAMGILDENNIAQVRTILEATAKSFSPLDLKVTRTQTLETPSGRRISDAPIENDKELTRLHIDLMKSLRPYVSHNDVQGSMFFAPPEVAEISTIWVQHYFDNQTPEGFHLHITLGEGTVKQPAQPIRFTAARLALCHLGNYCTCRRVLAEVRL